MPVTVAEPALFFDNDNAVVLEFFLVKPDSTVYDLTGAFVVLLVEGGSANPYTVVISSATDGQCQSTIAADSFLAGVYRAQLRVTKGDNTFHSQVFTLQVGQSIIQTSLECDC